MIAVVDTGARLDHPDLEGQFAVAADGSIGTDLVDADDVPDDGNGHGTLVAGIVAAAAGNGEGVAGVAPGARILPVRVLDDVGRGRTSAVDRGIRWAVDNGADIVNLSLEVEDRVGSVEDVLVVPDAAIRYAWDRGVAVVAATGNSGAGATGYPEDSPVLLVGAIDQSDELAPFSDAGRTDAVVAPGTDMVSAWCRPQGDGCDPSMLYGVGTGTSFAAPVASGVLALLLGTGLDVERAVRVLRATAVDLGPAGPDERFGRGRIDAVAAVAAAADAVREGGGTAAAASPAPTASPSPSDRPTLVPREEPAVDLPGSAGPAPAIDDRPTAGPATEDDREPGDGSATLAAVAVVLLLLAAAGAARAATAGRRDGS